MKRNIISFFLVLIVNLPVFSKTIHVPGDQPTVRAALESAVEGDTVQVAGGTVARQVYFQSHNIVLIGETVLGEQFRRFINHVNVVPSGDKSAIVDSFMTAAPGFPFTEGDVFAYYIYRGSVSRVNVPGDANGWNANAFAMTNLSGTNFWYRETVFEPTARLDYKFVLNGSNWILDPRNPHTVSGGFGPNSELPMPEYVQPQEVVNDPNAPKGALHDTLFASSILNNSRTIRIYTPPGYDAAPNDSFPMILFHDGQEYLSLASAATIFDNLIAAGRIQPLIGVFVPPVNRNEEYGFSQRLQFEQFIIEEALPMIAAKFRIKSDPAARAMTGPSLGGLISTQICYNHPDKFGLSAPYSPAYWVNSRVVFNSVVNGPQKDVKFYLDWGTYEQSIMTDGRLMRDFLTGAGYETAWNEWYEGHSWGSWRAHLDNMLEYFFPGVAVGVNDEQRLPKFFELDQNYPNPFNPDTIIRYRLSTPAQVSLQVINLRGQNVQTLINDRQPPGEQSVVWNGLNRDGQPVASGLYFYRLMIQTGADREVLTRKMLLVR